MILENITCEDVYLKYFGDYPVLNKKYYSPFQQENTPSFCFYYRAGEIRFKCFSTGNVGDCIAFVGLQYGKTYEQALDIIYYDFKLSKKSKSKSRRVLELVEEEYKEQLDVVLRKWEEYDINYWLQYGISRTTLDIYNVKPVSTFWVNNTLKWSNNEINPIYRYRFGERIKVYRPLNKDKKSKWRSNCDRRDIQGFKQLKYDSNIVFITSSLKDVMCLYELGYEAIAPQAESNYLEPKLIEYLESKYDQIILFYNSDEPGIKSTNKILTQYVSIKNIYIPIEIAKDPSDCIKNIGVENTKKLIIKLLNSI